MTNKTAMISSSARDLPEHRRMVMDACQRLGFKPIMMEHLAAQDRSAQEVSIGMVEDADVYLGIFAHAYGSTPDDDTRSYTEIEFDKAVSLGIPVLPFFADENTPWPPRLVDKGDKAEKLDRLKQKAAKDRIRAEFKSPEDLRGLVIHALGHFEKSQRPVGEEPAPSFHPPNIIPTAPEPYIAHPYSLLQTPQVVGRQAELNLLTDWVSTNKQVPASVRLFNVVAIGGMGKSALTWKWFKDIAPNELPNSAGWMWWSFYESDAHYENFIIRALAYASGQTERGVRALTFPEREDHLCQLLEERPFVFVLDGLERILLAYSRIDAAQMLDDDLDERTANWVVNALGLPESAAQSFIGKHQLRMTSDHRAGEFLRRLTRVRASRILISTRLYPAEIQAETGEPLPGCFAYFIIGLTDDDALNLWREFKVSGSREELLPLFRSFNNYPLLIRALSGEVSRYRNAPGDFDKWRVANPDFNPGRLPLKNAKTHVLEYALRGLDETQRHVLHTVAAFRMPVTWETLEALLIGNEPITRVQTSAFGSANKTTESLGREFDYHGNKKPCASVKELDYILTELEDRGLLSWDKKANRYDLHPIVRSIVWQTLDGHSREGLYRELHTFFDAVPKMGIWQKVKSLDDLTPTIELYNTLVGLRRFDDAYQVFKDQIDEATYYRLSANARRIELLQPLFSTGPNPKPILSDPFAQGYTLNSLGTAYLYVGLPSRAVPFFMGFVEVSESEHDHMRVAIGLGNLAESYLYVGSLHLAQAAGLRELAVAREMSDLSEEDVSLEWIALIWATTGWAKKSKMASQRMLQISQLHHGRPSERVLELILGERLVWLGQPEKAFSMAHRAWAKAENTPYARVHIEATRLYGIAALHAADWVTAAEKLQDALVRSRNINLVKEELPARIALAELYRRRHKHDLAREFLEQVWTPAELGPYPLFHADACNTLARIERDEGNRDAAIAAARRAFELAWCDGPPYAYHFGLTNAKQLLTELGATNVIARLESELPPFDESKFEPVPDVEINPKDEFWVDPDTLDQLPELD